MRIDVGRAGAVCCRAELDLPLSARTAWGRLRDFSRFASHDYFHAEVCIEGGAPRRGAALAIRHRFLAFGVDRVGRILRWREFDPADTHPAGYSFSDLSARGPRRGFPHVFTYSLRPAGRKDDRCRLEIAVRGRWTAPVPRWAAKLWLWWVFAHVVLSVRNSLLATAVTRVKAPLISPASASPIAGSSALPARHPPGGR
jgi:hypothetical protein